MIGDIIARIWGASSCFVYTVFDGTADVGALIGLFEAALIDCVVPKDNAVVLET